LSAESDAINRIEQELVDAVNAGDLNQFLGTLADDVMYHPPEQPRITGKNAVHLWLKETFFDPFRMRLGLTLDELEVLGSLAVGHGRFALLLAPRAGGSDTRMTGRFIHIFRGNSDGSWKFARVIWISDQPAAGGQ